MILKLTLELALLLLLSCCRIRRGLILRDCWLDLKVHRKAMLAKDHRLVHFYVASLADLS